VGRRVERRLGVNRPPGATDGRTSKQAEAELRRLMAEEIAGVAYDRQRTIEEPGARYRCDLRRHLGRGQSPGRER